MQNLVYVDLTHLSGSRSKAESSFKIRIMKPEDKKIGVVVLAAGTSSRLGQPKQLLNYNEKPLLQHTLDLVSELEGANSVVVLGASADKIIDRITIEPSFVAINRRWSNGLASSILCGLEYLNKEWPNTEYALFLVGDQPYLSLGLLKELVSSAKQSKNLVIASTYLDQVGVPALFHRSLFTELSSLTGDEGAKKVIENNIANADLVPFKRGEVDIDTMADYESLLANL